MEFSTQQRDHNEIQQQCTKKGLKWILNSSYQPVCCAMVLVCHGVPWCAMVSVALFVFWDNRDGQTGK